MSMPGRLIATLKWYPQVETDQTRSFVKPWPAHHPIGSPGCHNRSHTSGPTKSSCPAGRCIDYRVALCIRRWPRANPSFHMGRHARSSIATPLRRSRRRRRRALWRAHIRRQPDCRPHSDAARYCWRRYRTAGSSRPSAPVTQHYRHKNSAPLDHHPGLAGTLPLIGRLRNLHASIVHIPVEVDHAVLLPRLEYLNGCQPVAGFSLPIRRGWRGLPNEDRIQRPENRFEPVFQVSVLV